MQASREAATQFTAIAADYWMPDPRANVEQPEVWPSLRGFERDGV